MSANRLWCCSITYTNGIAKRIAAGGVLTQRLKETCVHDWSAFGCQPPRPDELYTLSNGDICFNASCGLGDAVLQKYSQVTKDQDRIYFYKSLKTKKSIKKISIEEVKDIERCDNPRGTKRKREISGLTEAVHTGMSPHELDSSVSKSPHPSCTPSKRPPKHRRMAAQEENRKTILKLKGSINDPQGQQRQTAHAKSLKIERDAYLIASTIHKHGLLKLRSLREETKSDQPRVDTMHPLHPGANGTMTAETTMAEYLAGREVDLRFLVRQYWCRHIKDEQAMIKMLEDQIIEAEGEHGRALRR